MADRSKESVFLSHSEVDADNDKNDHPIQFRSGYAFYKYDAKRSSPEKDGDRQHSSVSSTETDSSSQSHKDFSVTTLTTSLYSEDDSALTRFLNRKLVKRSIGTGNGHISAVDLGFGDTEPGLYLCYYRLLRQKSSSPESNTTITADDLVSLGLDDLELPSDKTEVSCPDQFILCLIAPADSQLDLFKADLDKFSATVLSKIDFEASDVVSVVKPFLETWFESTTNFLRNCVQYLGNDIKYLIHAALTDHYVDITCPDQKLTKDLRRFIECCSLSDLLSSSSNAGTPNSAADLLVDFSENTTSTADEAKSIHIRIEDGKAIFDNHDCSKFCEDWAHALEICDYDNVSLLRQIIESYKLKAIQDMNTLKRLLKQAETDHYSLYRCYMFLKQCGNGVILLQHAEQELTSSQLQETAQVLGVLHEYIRQSGGLVR